MGLALLAAAIGAVHAGVRVSDDTGRMVELPAAAVRIVSLAPDLTELVYAVGAGKQLVGAVDYSDYPDAAKKLPRVGDAFRVDLERLLALKPDLVLAWQGGTPQFLIERLRTLKLPVLVIGTDQLTDIARNLELIGTVTGHEIEAHAAARKFLVGLDALQKKYAWRAPVSVLYEISAIPLYTIGGRQSISRLIALCGGRNLFSDLTALAAPVNLEAVLARNPQAIITGSDGDAQQRLAAWHRWPLIAAVRRDNLFVVDSDLTARATPRILQGGQQLCEDLDTARRRLAGQHQ
ncbi:MAG: cobalamin-binding protein [Gammaproteobacteria bacterium]|nr:cobalamin-binding protein [Gammaproteobacteria bacterium]